MKHCATVDAARLDDVRTGRAVGGAQLRRGSHPARIGAAQAAARRRIHAYAATAGGADSSQKGFRNRARRTRRLRNGIGGSAANARDLRSRALCERVQRAHQ